MEESLKKWDADCAQAHYDLSCDIELISEALFRVTKNFRKVTDGVEFFNSLSITQGARVRDFTLAAESRREQALWQLGFFLRNLDLFLASQRIEMSGLPPTEVSVQAKFQQDFLRAPGAERHAAVDENNLNDI